MSSAIKFRPSLSLSEIHTLLSYIPAHESSLRKKLEIFTLKAQHGITQASHVATGRATLADSLGFTSPIDAYQSNQTIEELLQVYNTNPKVLTHAQLARVNQHRYVNDMMTPEEEAAHEIGG